MKKLKKKAFIFFIKFMVIFFFLHALIYFIDISWLQNSIAALTAQALNLRFEGSRIFIQEQVFEISKSCTGLISSFILSAIIFSLKKPEFKVKVITYAIGTIALLLINLFRVFVVLVAGIYYGVFMAEALHVLSWFVMSGLIIALWYYFNQRIFAIKSFEGFL